MGLYSRGELQHFIKNRYMNTLRLALAEFFGTLVLVATVVGSGIMGTQMSSDPGVALLINTLSTIFVLALLILILGPISGAHLNPAVTLVLWAKKLQPGANVLPYVVAQIAGAISGAILANVMFDQSPIQIAATERVSVGLFIGEIVATAGLLAVILVFIARNQAHFVPFAVAAWIGSAYFFTSSTSFANPAVTIGRVFSDSFSGISPESVGPFVLAQLMGAALGAVLAWAIIESSNKKANHVG
jgi:glycerol uptake facilitator-like aquaporin